jgi:hypothetical protein
MTTKTAALTDDRVYVRLAHGVGLGAADHCAVRDSYKLFFFNNLLYLRVFSDRF